jgi:hypothetical protein
MQRCARFLQRLDYGLMMPLAELRTARGKTMICGRAASRRRNASAVSTIASKVSAAALAGEDRPDSRTPRGRPFVRSTSVVGLPKPMRRSRCGRPSV